MDRAGTFIVYPTNASEPVEHFAAEAQGDWRQQVYLFDNRKVSEAFIERSVASGAKALMLTWTARVIAATSDSATASTAHGKGQAAISRTCI